MLKKTVTLFFCFIFGGIAYSQQLTLSKAIQDSVQKIESEIKTGQRVAVFNFISESNGLSDHIINEIMNNIVNDKKLLMVERYRIDAIMAERGIQFSGEVDDKEIVSIGNFAGAQYVISGSLNFVGSSYRFNLFAIDIARGVRVVNSLLPVKQNDSDIVYFLDTTTPLKNRSNSQNNRSNIDDWRNKQAYIGGWGGYGEWYGGYDFPDIGIYRGGVIGFKTELSMAQYFSIDFDLGVEIGNTGLGFVTPCADIFAHVPFRFDFGLDIGVLGGIFAGDPYYFGVGGGASLGYKVGNGILFFEAVYLRSFLRASDPDFDDTGYILRLGYKVGVGKKNKL